MNSLDENLDDSALCTLSIIQKRKAADNIHQKKSKQVKIDIHQVSEKSEQKQSYEDLNESTSSYFERKFSNMCPLCLKLIEGDTAFMAHTKSCAKKHNMTTQEVLKALDLQKKHIKERKELGLPSQVHPLNKKTVKKKLNKNVDSCDVGLAIALSKSLEESKPVLTEKGKTTLIEFGFKTNQVLTSVGNGSRRDKLLQKSTLKLRTEEDRQRIITEKVAAILLDEDSTTDIEKKSTAKFEFSKQLGNIVNEVPHLWNLGENEGQFEWYIQEMKPLILVEEKVSEVCGKEKTSALSSSEDLQDFLPNLNYVIEKLSEDWRNMINNSKFSDLVGRTKDFQTVYMHSLVLQTRCADILKKDYQSVFEKFNFSTVLIFLEFLYCGTLKTLIRSEVENLCSLASAFNCEELIKVLNSFENVEKTSQEEISIIESNSKVLNFLKDKTESVEDLVDLTQSSHSTNDDKHSEDECDVEKSFWSFIQQEKEKEELRKEEDAEKSSLLIEKEKIEMNAKQRDEQVEMITEKEEEYVFGDSLELKKICESQKVLSPVHVVQENITDCIILSSDSETRWSKPDSPELKISSPLNLDYEIPCFDPYDDIMPSMELSPVDSHSESLISGNISCEFPQHQGNKESEVQPGYCSTPVSKCQNFRRKSSNKKPLMKKKRSDLSASRLIRKSLNLHPKRISISAKRKTSKRKSIKENEAVDGFSNSNLLDLSKSLASEPQSVNNFVEITPKPGRDEFEECATPSPNYSNMGDSILKEHLARYGLKRSMGKCKAKKILRHIYEELHPRVNIETGKIVKMLPGNTPTRKKAKPTKKVAKRKVAKAKEKSGNSSEETLKAMDESLSKSADDLSGSEFENLNNSLTQSSPNDPVDLPSAFCEFIDNNVEFHTKILLYEPIWLEDLQSRLKKMFKKHFKLSDLMDYLDQKCITFRTEAQKKVNQKRAEKKNSPHKKTSG